MNGVLYGGAGAFGDEIGVGGREEVMMVHLRCCGGVEDIQEK
jgi:hypothetical protein